MPVPVKVQALFVSVRLDRRKAGRNMVGETNGGLEATQGAENQAQQQGQEQQETQRQHQSQVGGNETDYEKQIAERDEKIASLEAQVAEAAKNAETAEQLRGEIAELKVQGESDRIDFKLQLAGVRNVKAARALLATTTTTWTSSRRQSPGSSRRRASTPRAATPAPARPGSPTRARPATRARRSSTGAKSRDSPTTIRRSKTCLATTSHSHATTPR